MHVVFVLQDACLNDQSHVVGAEMSVYDFNYEDNSYPATSNEVPSGARWVEGYSAGSEVSSDQRGSHSAGLKLRVSNRQIVGLVNSVCLC